MQTLSTVSCKHCEVEFTPNSNRQEYCSVKCRQDYNNAALRKSKSQSAMRMARKKREMLNDIKTKSGCVKCGYNEHPAALDFNHKDPSQKLGNIAEKAKSWSYKKLLDEVAKCEVLCANCHRIHSYETHPSRLGKSGTPGIPTTSTTGTAWVEV